VLVRWRRELPKLHAGLDAGPLVIFDKFGAAIVISAFDNFMATSYHHDTDSATVSWGVMGKVDSVSKGFHYSTVMYCSDRGVNKVVV